MSQLWPYSARLVGNTLQTVAGKPFLIVAVKGRYLTLRLASTGKERRVQQDEIEATDARWDRVALAPGRDAIPEGKASGTNAPYLVPLVRELRRIAALTEPAL